MTQRLSSVQHLRGYAAMAVVVLHARLLAADVATRAGTLVSVEVLPLFGARGVDLFFVISGFVMTQVVANARASASFEAGAGGFLLRRIARVVPLYWVATLAMALRWRWRMPVEGAAALLAVGALLGATVRWPMPSGVRTDPLLLEFGVYALVSQK